MYQDWGFSSSPFETTSLPASELGEILLVGRDNTVNTLMKRISSGGKLSTVEGLNGVGKTSVVNVCAYKMFKSYFSAGDGPLFIPCRSIFQLDQQRDPQDFIDHVLMEVAQTLIEQSESVKQHGYYLQTAAIDRWLNAPQVSSFQAGFWNVQVGKQSETNTSIGFERNGFRKNVTGWLNTIYPSAKDGAVICTIDNLELLQSSDEARRLLEQLRDELFSISGIRWVLCGSLGIIYGVVASPRLEGYLHNPIEIAEIGADHAKEILESRIRSYALDQNSYYLPITSNSFELLYSVMRGNIRSVLAQCDNFCQWVSDRDIPKTDEEKFDAFDTWLREQASNAYEAVRKNLRPKAMEVFELACERVIFSPSDFEDFGFNSVPAFRPHVKDLEDAGALVSTQDEGDKRRKTIQVTPKGWLINHHMTSLRPPQILGSGGTV